MFSKLFIFGLGVAVAGNVTAQCCSGGSGSPIAGGASQGVLQERQLELSTSFQHIKTNRFYNADSPDTAVYFDSYRSNYLYNRIGYGITKNLTLSLEAGYFLDKTQIGLNNVDTFSAKGIGDLIVFPRSDIINYTEEDKRTELTLGLGYKIPLGSSNDSSRRIEPFSGMEYYITKPLGVQTSSGAQDIILYLFAYRGYTSSKFRMFANAMYIRKGWNGQGEKVGDYASVGLFAGKTLFDNLGLTLQVKGEWVDKMQLNPDIRMFAYPNYDPDATGSKKVFVIPQLSYTFLGRLTVYGLLDIPVYQYVTKNQAVTELQFSAGLSYRFFVVRA